MTILRLTERDVPSGSLIAVLSDIHIPHHDTRAMRVVVECCEAIGVDHVILNGDIADCGPSSRHDGKRLRETLTSGTLAESAYPGKWIIDWARTRSCYLIRGNHEAWVENRIAEDSTLAGSVTPEKLLGWHEDEDGWRVLASGSRIRIGSLVVEHGDGFFKRSSGGVNPAVTMLRKAPDQSTLIGHVHRMSAAWSTTRDEMGVRRTRAAFSAGHLSIEESHTDYMGGYPGWQQSWTLIRVYWDRDRPRFTITPVEIHRDRLDRPFFELGGRVYR